MISWNWQHSSISSILPNYGNICITLISELKEINNSVTPKQPNEILRKFFIPVANLICAVALKEKQDKI